MLRDYSWLIAVAFGLGLSIALATPMLRWVEIKPSDWLGFAGALIGVGGAVYGAGLVERNRLLAQRRADMKRLASALNTVSKAIEYFIVPVAGEDEASPLNQKQRAELLLQGFRTLDHAVRNVPIQDVALWSALNFVETRQVHLVGKLSEIVSMDGDDALSNQEVTAACTALLPRLDALRRWYANGRERALEL